ncbi:MAG: ComEC/Rec2 family competence protein [Clostridia bacterium]|nr:ComEC/Rec2 family competence protein [Clostridia bacterium]
MKIFDKRPLSLILCILLSGFVFFSIYGIVVKISLLAIGTLLILVPAFIPIAKFAKKWFTVACGGVLVISCFLSLLYFNTYFLTYERYQGEAFVCGTVESIESHTGMRNVTLDVDTINGDKFISHKVLLNLDINEAENLSVGSSVSFGGILSEFTSDTDFDIKAYYYSRGYSATVQDVTDIEISPTVKTTIKNRISSYRLELCRRMVMYSNAESGGLLGALLLGEKAYLSGEIRHDFTRAGISHILALSGMHLAILSYALGKLLSFLKIKKTYRKLIEIVFVFAYMMLTGFPVSVVRAGIMLILSSVLFLLSHRHDSITTLFISVTIICALEPYAIFDISLWLSAFATLGILLLVELDTKNAVKREAPTILVRIVKPILFSVISSLFAIGATIIFSATSFGALSVLSPITTTLISPIIQVFMYLGTLFCFFGNILSFGELISGFGDIIIKIVRWISSINAIYTSAEFVFIQISIFIFTLAFFAFATLDIKNKKAYTAFLCIFLVLIHISSYAATAITKQKNILRYNAWDNNEQLILQDGGNTAVIDISTPSSSSAYQSVSFLKEQNITEIEHYVFTDYSTRLLSSVDSLISVTYVNKIYIPSPQTAEETVVAENVAKLLKPGKATLCFYESGDFLTLGEFVMYPAYRSADEETRFAFTLMYNDNFYTYLSSGMLKNDTKNVALPLIDGCDTLILGRHGSVYDEYEFIYKIEVDAIIFASLNMTVPNETLDFYKNTRIYYSPTRQDIIH